ncbi:MFS transporter [Chitinophaga varians]|uniref:MFS transporter n=2 Tax=Chitinophaga varians TaxID=2202339 RepID=A0A847RKV6_9BACT|nr:MFS transporter [Chitinophaga varians]
MWKPVAKLTQEDTERGMRLVIGDGLAAEVMTTLTSGAFLVAMALMLGASNLQIGVLSALPTFTNIFQLISIWLVRRSNNRRAVTVICTILARIPLVVIGVVPLIFPGAAGIQFLIVFLSVFYFFGSLAGPSWNAWVKDLVPESMLGSYFSRRGSYTQTLNVVLSLAAALGVDYIRKQYPQYELDTYYLLFLLAGIAGLTGAAILSRAPEQQVYMDKENIFRLLKRPLSDLNFVRLLVFNSAWVFAMSIAQPFFTVYMMKGMGLSLSYITVLTIISQLFGIFTIRIWGTFADRYSNKTIIAISAPLYIISLILWCFVGIYTKMYANIILLVIVHILMGVANAGINLSITNIGLKLAPAKDAIVYLSAKNIITAVFSALGPVAGGILADFFEHKSLKVDAVWKGETHSLQLHLVALHEWNFLFLIAAVIAVISLEMLMVVNETGEVEKNTVVRIMRSSIKNNLKDYYLIGNLITLHDRFWGYVLRRKPS